MIVSSWRKTARGTSPKKSGWKLTFPAVRKEFGMKYLLFAFLLISASLLAEEEKLAPLETACQKGEVEKVKSILKGIPAAEQNQKAKGCLATAVSEAHIPLVRFLVERKTPLDHHYGWTPLHRAAKLSTPDHLKIARILVDAGARVDVGLKSPDGEPYMGPYGIGMSPLGVARKSRDKFTDEKARAPFDAMIAFLKSRSGQ